jgi:hypothetical protein
MARGARWLAVSDSARLFRENLTGKLRSEIKGGMPSMGLLPIKMFIVLPLMEFRTSELNSKD